MAARSWSSQEDFLLQRAVGQHSSLANVDWCQVALHVPSRNNRDCRKRWYNHLGSVNNKGPWSPAEDERLKSAVEIHGTRWTKVASQVVTRNGDQCSKRWNDSLKPNINHDPWTAEEDAALLQGIEQLGRRWKAIAERDFKDRTPLSLKNRASLLERRSNPKSQPHSGRNSGVSTPRSPSISDNAIMESDNLRRYVQSGDFTPYFSQLDTSVRNSFESGLGVGFEYDTSMSDQDMSLSSGPRTNQTSSSSPLTRPWSETDFVIQSDPTQTLNSPSSDANSFHMSFSDPHINMIAGAKGDSVSFEQQVAQTPAAQPVPVTPVGRKRITFEFECEPQDLGRTTQEVVTAFKRVNTWADLPVSMRFS